MRPVVRLVVAATVGLVAGVFPARAANDPGAPQQWNMGIVGAEAAWATGTGTSATVAVVDTGIHLSHEDLAGRTVAGWNFVEDNATPQDDHGHGTHVAGILGATANNGRGVIGVAPGIKIMPIRVLRADPEGDGATGSTGDISAGIRWAADHGAHVINISLGTDLQGVPLFGPQFVEAIEHAWEKGAICVVAAGNDALQSSGFDHETHAIVVTATTRTDAQAFYASDIGRFLVNDPQWGMAAPGGAGTHPPDDDDILSTYWTPSTSHAYAWAAGTSMAAPHVSGAVAILRALGLSRDQAVHRVTTTAKDLGNPGTDNRFGWGRLDVAKAVAGLKPASGGGGSGSGGGGATTTTTRTRSTTGTRPGQTASSAGTGSTAPAAGSATTPTTVDASRSGEPTGTGGDGVRLEELGRAEAGLEANTANGNDGGGSGDTGSPVWPLGLPAAAALAAVAGAAARARRGRV